MLAGLGDPQIFASDDPGHRGSCLHGVALSPLVATAYLLLQHSMPTSFTEPITRTDALYFSVTVFTTVGFGDISAKTETARIVMTIQMILDVALLADLAGCENKPASSGLTQRSGLRRLPTIWGRPSAPGPTDPPRGSRPTPDRGDACGISGKSLT